MRICKENILHSSLFILHFNTGLLGNLIHHEGLCWNATCECWSRDSDVAGLWHVLRWSIECVLAFELISSEGSECSTLAALHTLEIHAEVLSLVARVHNLHDDAVRWLVIDSTCEETVLVVIASHRLSVHRELKHVRTLVEREHLLHVVRA